MADKLNFYQQKINSPADRLRAELKLLEDRAVALPKKDKDAIVDYLAHLDTTQKLFAHLQKIEGSNTAAEQSRWDTVQKHFFRRAKIFYHILGGKSALRALRPEDARPDSHPWWFLDDFVAAQRAKARKRAFIISGVTGGIVAVLIILFNTLLKPNPTVIAKTRHFDAALEALTQNQGYAAALNEIDQALAAMPNDTDSLVFKGELLLKLGRNAEAESVFSQAEALASTPDAISLARGSILFQMGDVDGSLVQTQRVLKINPNSAEGWFLAGQIYLQQKKNGDAYDAFSRAADLAFAQENDSLYTIAKMNMVYITPNNGGDSN